MPTKRASFRWYNSMPTDCQSSQVKSSLYTELNYTLTTDNLSAASLSNVLASSGGREWAEMTEITDGSGRRREMT